MPLHGLAEDFTQIIFSFLPAGDLLRAASADRFLCEQAFNPALWRHLCLTRFGAENCGELRRADAAVAAEDEDEFSHGMVLKELYLAGMPRRLHAFELNRAAPAGAPQAPLCLASGGVPWAISPVVRGNSVRLAVRCLDGRLSERLDSVVVIFDTQQRAGRRPTAAPHAPQARTLRTSTPGQFQATFPLPPVPARKMPGATPQPLQCSVAVIPSTSFFHGHYAEAAQANHGGYYADHDTEMDEDAEGAEEEGEEAEAEDAMEEDPAPEADREDEEEEEEEEEGGDDGARHWAMLARLRGRYHGGARGVFGFGLGTRHYQEPKVFYGTGKSLATGEVVSRRTHVAARKRPAAPAGALGVVDDMTLAVTLLDDRCMAASRAFGALDACPTFRLLRDDTLGLLLAVVQQRLERLGSAPLPTTARDLLAALEFREYGDGGFGRTVDPAVRRDQALLGEAFPTTALLAVRLRPLPARRSGLQLHCKFFDPTALELRCVETERVDGDTPVGELCNIVFAKLTSVASEEELAALQHAMAQSPRGLSCSTRRGATLSAPFQPRDAVGSVCNDGDVLFFHFVDAVPVPGKKGLYTMFMESQSIQLALDPLPSYSSEAACSDLPPELTMPHSLTVAETTPLAECHAQISSLLRLPADRVTVFFSPTAQRYVPLLKEALQNRSLTVGLLLLQFGGRRTQQGLRVAQLYYESDAVRLRAEREEQRLRDAERTRRWEKYARAHGIIDAPGAGPPAPARPVARPAPRSEPAGPAPAPVVPPALPISASAAVPSGSSKSTLLASKFADKTTAAKHEMLNKKLEKQREEAMQEQKRRKAEAERIRNAIREDKEDRFPVRPGPAAGTAAPATAAAPAAAAPTECVLQVRMPDGTMLRQAFPAATELATVHAFVVANLPTARPFRLCAMPREVLGEDKLHLTLEQLKLCPRAQLAVHYPQS